MRQQHGQPLQIIDMGETAIDEETFNEYLEEMREHYTADKVRHPIQLEIKLGSPTAVSLAGQVDARTLYSLVHTNHSMARLQLQLFHQ